MILCISFVKNNIKAFFISTVKNDFPYQFAQSFELNRRKATGAKWTLKTLAKLYAPLKRFLFL